MDTFEIVKYPSSILRKKAKEVEHISAEQREILDKMAQTMYENEAVGVAAEQVDLDMKLIVIDARDKHGLLKLINPEIIEKEGIEYMNEQCLSCPGVAVRVPRARKVKVKAKNERGEDVTFEVNGLLARIFQHEIDHLNGRIIIDYLNPVKRLFVYFRFYLKNLFKRGQQQK